MNGSIAELACTVIDPSVPCTDTHRLSLCGIGADTTNRGNFQTSVVFNLSDHGAQCINMGLYKNSIVCILSSKVCDHAPFYRTVSRKSECFKLL